MPYHHRSAMLLAALLATSLAGCNRGAPTGEVLATVDGTDITAAQLDAESRATNVSVHDDQDLANRKALLTTLVERQLLVNAAHASGLDRDPQVMADLLRQQQMLLANQILSQRIAKSDPSDGEADAFIKANPQAFADRRLLKVDQIRFATASTSPASIKHTPTLDDVDRYLRDLAVPSQRSVVIIDSAQVAPALTAKLIAEKGGEPVYFSAGGTTFFNTLVDERPVADSLEDQRATARRGLQQVAVEGQVRKITYGLRSDAKIAYQTGFEPAQAAIKGKPAPRPQR